MMSNNEGEHRAKRTRMLEGANEGNSMEYYTDSDSEDADEDMLVPGNHVRVHTSFDDDDMEDDMDEDDMVEAKVSTIETATLGTLTVTTEIKPDYESHIDEIIEISCTYVDGTGTRNTAGSAKGRVIDPDVIEIGQWHDEMDAPSKDCMDLAHTLFDAGGKLKDQWSAQSNGPEKGTGAWSNLPGDLNWETENWSKFAVIETIEVAMAQRRGGLATFMVQAFINEAIDKQTAFVFAWPTQLDTAPDSSNAPGLDETTKQRVFEENKAKAIAFWRAQGFRRVGASHWFCYAVDPSHLSRNLAKENDFDPVA